MIRLAPTRALLLSACMILAGPAARAEDPGVSDKEIVIGLHAPLSGPLVSFGRDSLNAAKMWYEEVNAKGGIHGRKFKIVVEDDKCTPQDAVAVMKKMITIDKVFLINGGSCSQAFVTQQEVATREKIPLIALNASADVAVFPPTRYVFAGSPGTATSIGPGMVDFVVKQFNAKRIAILVDDNESGVIAIRAATISAKRLGVEIVVAEKVPMRMTDLTAPVLKVREAKADAVIMVLYPQSATLAMQKRFEYGLKQPWAATTNGVPVPEIFAKNVGNNEALRDFYFAISLSDVPTGKGQERWMQMYKRYYPIQERIGAFMALGLINATAITAALEKVGRDLTREKFVDAMEQLEIDTGVAAGPIGFAKDRRDALRTLKIVKFDGVKTELMPGNFAWNGKDGR